MPDKRSELHITQKFINNSWKDMSALLNKEMPVQKSYKNRLLWLLSGLLICAIVTIVYLLAIQLNEIPVANLTKEKIIYKEVFIEKYIDAKTQGLKDSRNLDSGTLKYQNSGDLFAQMNNSHLQSNINILNFGLTPSLNDGVNIVPTENRAGSLNEMPTLENKEILIPFSSSTSDLLVPVLEKNNTLENEELETTRKLKFNISMLTFITNSSDYSGFGLGSGVQIPIGKRLGIHTGLALNFISRDYTILPFIQKNNQDQLLKANETADLDNKETYYSGLRSFNQILVPFNINYNFKNGWSISSGLKFRYTYSEQLDNILKGQANRKLPVNESAENLIFNDTNVGLSAGFGYIINKNLSFNIDSEWGLKSMISGNSIVRPSNAKYDLNLINLSTNYTF